MPIQVPAKTLRQITKLVVEIREDGEARIDISSDRIRVRTLAEDLGAFLDLSISTTVPELTVDAPPASYWIDLERLHSLLTVILNENVILHLPNETPDSRFTFQATTLTYWLAPLDENTAHRIFDNISAQSTTAFSIQNSAFNLGVSVANLVSTELQVQFNHPTQHVTFSANDPGGDSFTYSEHVDQVHTADRTTDELLISVDYIGEIASIVPPTDSICIELTPNHLTFRAEYPIQDATLTVYLAKYLQAISKP